MEDILQRRSLRGIAFATASIPWEVRSRRSPEQSKAAANLLWHPSRSRRQRTRSWPGRNLSPGGSPTTGASRHIETSHGSRQA
jgi:hypothetical protein